jgi:hypothetical protein
MRTRTPLSLHELEHRLTPAAVFKYTDVDGDTVTVRSSKGTNSQLASVILVQKIGLGSQLWELDVLRRFRER